MYGNQQTIIPSTGGAIAVPMIPGVGQTGIVPSIPGVNNASIIQPAVTGHGSPINGVSPVANQADPNIAFVNIILRPCADAVAQRLPLLIAQGKEIKSQLIMEECFLPAFQSLASHKSYVQGMPVSSGISGGIRPPQKASPVAPGTPSNVNLEEVPNHKKVYYPEPGMNAFCWWRTIRGGNKGAQCTRPIGNSDLFCDKCYTAKSSARTRHLKAAQAAQAQGRSVRDYLFSLKGNAPLVGASSSPYSSPGPVTPTTQDQDLPVSHYPGETGVLYRSPEGYIYSQSGGGITAIGADAQNSGVIMPFTQNQLNHVKSIGIGVNDSLARSYVRLGGLPAAKLDAQGKLVTQTVGVQSFPQGVSQGVSPPQGMVPQGMAPQGIPAVIPSQGIPAVTVPQQVMVSQGIPAVTVPQQVAPQPIIPSQGMFAQGLPAVTVPQQVIPQQVIPQQVMPQQVIPQQVMPQQVIPQQISPSQGLVSQGFPTVTAPQISPSQGMVSQVPAVVPVTPSQAAVVVPVTPPQAVQTVQTIPTQAPQVPATVPVTPPQTVQTISTQAAQMPPVVPVTPTQTAQVPATIPVTPTQTAQSIQTPQTPQAAPATPAVPTAPTTPPTPINQ